MSGYYDSVTSGIALLNAICDWLVAAVPSFSAQGSNAAIYRREIGYMRANAEFYVRNGGLSTPLLALFTDTRLMGATYETFDIVRVELTTFPHIYGNIATAIQDASLIYTISQQVRILAGMTFTNRDEVNKYMIAVVNSFEPVLHELNDFGDPTTGFAFIRLKAACIRDLGERGRLLPYVVYYSWQKSFPALTMANRLYPDATLAPPMQGSDTSDRSDEIVAENKVIHPAFLPLTIRALSA